MNSLEFKNVQKVIKLAKKNGLKRLKVGTIEIEFEQSSLAQSSRAFKSTKSSKAIAKQTEMQNKYDEDKENLSIMHVEDPLAFEQALIDNEFEDDSSEGNSDRDEETRHIEA